MENTKLGRQTFRPGTPPVIIGHGSAAGKKEHSGPLGRGFDHTCEDDRFGQESWEKAESQMQQLALDAALKRAGLHTPDLDLLLAGDLLNQCIGSSFAARQAAVPYFGLYGACSTMGESLALAALLLSGGYGQYAAAVTSSHFCSAERQYRNPLEYGSQRTPTAQWTATAAGAVVLCAGGRKGPAITCVTVGKIADKGIKDANNMGAAMAP
jgi:stage V sporulation protein AD